MRRIAKLCLVWGIVPALLNAQDLLRVSIRPGRLSHPQVSFSKVAENELKVTVTDNGKSVGGLTPMDFVIETPLMQAHVLDVQPLIKTEKAKVSVVLCIDNSNSMKDHVDLLKTTIQRLLGTFGDSVKVAAVLFVEQGRRQPNYPFPVPKHVDIAPFTPDKAALSARLERQLIARKLTGRTYLYDEIYTAFKLMETVQDPEEKKYIVVFSDGRDVGSAQSAGDVSRLAESSEDLVLYAVDFLTRANPVLKKLATVTGGRHFRARSAGELSRIFEEISRDIRTVTGYLVTFRFPRAYLAGQVRARHTCEGIPDATLVSYPIDNPDHQTETKADPAGRFRIPAAFPHEWKVAVSAPGYFPDTARVRVEDKAVYLLNFELRSTRLTLGGRVVDPDSSPLPAARVVATDLRTGERLFAGETDSLGRYEFEIPSGANVLVHVTKDGYTFASVEQHGVENATQLPDFVLGRTAEEGVSEFRFRFAFGSDQLDTSDVASQIQLDACARLVERELAKDTTRAVRLITWVDDVGSQDFRLYLSNRRAQSLKEYLVSRGLPADRIEAVGRGVSEKYSHATEQGRALNRRTEVLFFDRTPQMTQKP